jgi:hypothetical protein
MKLGPLAFRLLQRAYDAAVRAPGDCAAHDRLLEWARLGSKVIGKPIEDRRITDGSGRAWIRVTAAILLSAMATHFGINGKFPAPQRTVGPLMTAITTASVSSSAFIINEMTGERNLAWPAVVRKPTTTIKDT